MMKCLKAAIAAAVILFAGASAYAQNANVKAVLTDESTGDAVSFATVSLTLKGADKPAKYVLSSENGSVLIEKVKSGTYTMKAELLGYHEYVKEITVAKVDLDLGKIEMKPDTEQLDAAKVSATGNPIIIKKDTIEYNASSFKTTDNDVLEDLLKKLPGVEVSEDGSITVNGETITKITIDGKTFFMDDPQLASKNIPAKIVNKLKVVEKKSEQAEFTGIDDGESETVIDLSIKPGMMKGLFGNVMGGAGHDLVPDLENYGDFRFQTAGFLGRFTDDSQISVIINGNNTNNRGFNDLAGSMMQGMRGGGGGMGRGQGGWGSGNGITTSYMGGVNGGWDLFDDKMELGANYLYNYSNNDVEESSVKNTYLDDYNLNYYSTGISNTASGGHRIGIHLDHKFSDNTSIFFDPQINWGSGNYSQVSQDSTYRDNLDGSDAYKLNSAYTNNTGENKNFSASGFALLRQRLGIPGRTLTVMARYSFSNNDLTGLNNNGTYTYDEAGNLTDTELVNQTFDNNKRSYSLMGRATYTEPIGHNMYVEANYAYNWDRSTSDKQTFDAATGALVDAYSNNIDNLSQRQDIGANLLYQSEAFRAQFGFSAMPTRTVNTTTSAGSKVEYDDFRWNFSPQAMFWGDFSENANGRLFYRGSSSQPSTSQLMPVPDNTDPLNISFGNPTLTPYFTHSLRGDFRYNNKQTFASFNIRFNGGMVQNPIVNAIWYGSNGAQYSMPVNGPASGNFGFNAFLNAPIAKSNFSISNMARVNWSKSSSYVGSNVNMSGYADPTEDYYAFMNAFIADRPNMDEASDFTRNTTENFSFTERLRATYKNDDLELTLSGRTRMNKSWYTISSTADNTTTWNNQVRATANWTWDEPGITVKGEYNYNWYRGYSTEQPSEHVLNAEIQKNIFKNKCTLALKGYDILGQAKNLTVTDASNYHTETLNNTLGRYIILSLTYRFGTFNNSGHRGPGGPMGPPPGM